MLAVVWVRSVRLSGHGSRDAARQRGTDSRARHHDGQALRAPAKLHDERKRSEGFRDQHMVRVFVPARRRKRHRKLKAEILSI